MFVNYSNNKFGSSIPVDFGDALITASSFSISHSKVVGIIPKSINKARLLRKLDLSSNSLTGTIPLDGSTGDLDTLEFFRINKKIGGSLSSLPDSLWILDLAYSGFGFSLVFTTWVFKHKEDSVVRDLLSSNKWAFSFYISNSKVVGVIPESINNAEFLRVLDISSNALTGPIPVDGSMRYLESLDLSLNNRFQGPLPEFIFKLPSISTLTLSGNNFSGSVHLDVFGKLKKLRELDLSNNRFQGPLPEFIFKLPSISTLKLSGNNFSGSTIPLDGSTGDLDTLDSSNNKISGRIPEQLTRLMSLEFLNVSYNRLSGKIPQGDVMVSYILQTCRMRDQSAMAVPRLSKLDLPTVVLVSLFVFTTWVFKHKEDSVVRDLLSSNKWAFSFYISNSKVVGVIPESINNAEFLRVLDISSNALTGPIPVDGSMRYLESLDLSLNNRFQGPLPEFIFKLPSISTLTLSGNNFSGSVHLDVFGKLKKLRELDLSYNDLTDDLSVIATKLGNHLMFNSYTSDMCMLSWGMSSYARAMIELRADVELKDTIVMLCPNLLMRVLRKSLRIWPVSNKNGASTSGKKKQAEVSIQEVSKLNPFDALNSIENDDDLGTNGWNSSSARKGVTSSSNSTKPIAEMIDKFERQLIESKLLLVDDDGKPLSNVVSTVNADSDSEVEEVFDEHTTFTALTGLKGASDSGRGTNSLWEQ
ncbi:homeobox protein knotted-1-like protein 2 [Tanacetum coccineum]|uniref:Homeobox protein knotted-1-like protein 2 n=1 Tax=Tanacetum coccineum TaxID=301880 RepID=A0ABQ4YED0_9ASTR